MISIARQNGALVKNIPLANEQVYGVHSLFGLISEDKVRDRMGARRHQGLSNERGEWLCRFRLKTSESGIAAESVEGCVVQKSGLDRVVIQFGNISYVIAKHQDVTVCAGVATPEESNRTGKISLAIAILALMILLLPSSPAPIVLPEPMEPVTVNVVREIQKSVKLADDGMTQLASKSKNSLTPGGAMVEQKLGFLKLLGKKDLRGAVGGMPTAIENATPGAGAGGTEGSGGELLVGLGQGVKRTTVGNSGVSGLGGVGKTGPGGGAGGYGNSLVGSGGMGNTLNGIGDGRRISTAALSEDIELDGGLDKSVIQATIAKYLSQVRACYEVGLRGKPGLAGQVTMSFEIGGQGSLNYAKVFRSSLGSSQVEGCIAERMMGWKFPEPLGGVNVKVSYPFLLRPVS